MALLRFRRHTLLASLVVAAAMAVVPAHADAEAAPGPAVPQKAKASGLPSGVSLSAINIRQDAKDGSLVAEGAVTIETDFGRFQADRVTFRDRHIVEAEGNVLVVWGENRISGTKMVYDLGLKDDPDPAKRIPRGMIENAVGQVEPEFYFDARKVETIGDDRVVLHTATVTTCTQPVPYWSFHVSKAKVKINGYAHLFNLRPTIGKVPFFYLPYLMWPVKKDRAPGLLFPEFGTTTNRGRLVSIPVFVPVGPSADITFMPQYYTIAGWGLGAKVRVIPNRDGYAEATGNYVADQVSGQGRYRAQVKQTQTFLNGFRMVSDVDIVSDFNYYTDYVRNLTYSSSPTLLGRVSFTRSGAWTSLMVQEQYREQLFPDDTTLVQSTLPEIQWRGRSRRLGKSPLYLSFVSSFDGIRQDGTRIQTDYMRGDVSPTLSLPYSPASWLDITPSIAFRSTYWTKQKSPASSSVILSDGLWRNLWGASLDIRGPKFFKIFETKAKPEKDGTPGKTSKYKNTIEPRLLYTYQQAYDKDSQIIIYDEVDRFGITANSFSYGIASRLIAQRPRASAEDTGGSGEKILVPEGESGKLREVTSAAPDTGADAGADAAAAAAASGAPVEPTPLEPVEIASVELSQSYSLNSNGSLADTNGNCLTAPVPDAKCQETSRFSAVALSGRYNPKTWANFNFTSRYDVLFHAVSEVSVSGNFRERLAKGLFSLVYRPGLAFQRAIDPATGQPYPPDPVTGLYPIEHVKEATQLRFQGDFGPIAGRLRLGMDATYNITPGTGEKSLPYQRWRMEYYTQCCGFLVEYLQYNYSTAPRKDFRFAVDLRGIGKLFDFNQGNQ
jgi:LPS-assembly protein